MIVIPEIVRQKQSFTRWSLVAWLLALAAGGCSDECPALTRCDIRRSGCQRGVMEAVACMRGGSSHELPAVSVISEDEYIERIEAHEEDPDAQAEAEAAYALWSRGLHLIDLAPASYDAEQARNDRAAQVGAAYFFDRKDIVIIDRGEPLDSNASVEILAHELVHALQDAELDLEEYQTRRNTSFDESLAVAALVEGEATHYQLLAAIQLEGHDPNRVDWERYYTEWRSETLVDAEGDEAPVALARMRFPYAFGGGMVSQYWLARGRAGIDDLFEHPPRSTSEVLFGANGKALTREREALHEHGAPALPETFAPQADTALGAWVARMYAGRHVTRVDARAQTAAELDADVFSYFYDAAQDSVIAAWRVHLREGSMASWWDEPNGKHVSSTPNDTSREVSFIAAESALPEDVATLAWRAPIDPEEMTEAASAAIGGYKIGVYEPERSTHIACALQRATALRSK